MSRYVDLYINAGEDFSSSIDLEADDGTAINIAGYVFTSQMRTSYYTANATANLVMTIADAANGNVTMSLDAPNTANVYPGKYVYDVKMKDTNNVITRVIEGIMTVTPQVTH